MIKWGDHIDRHIKGVSDATVWWIRTDKTKKVTALYKIVGRKTVKYIPEDGIEETVMGMQLKAEILAETLAFAKTISKNEQS